MMANKSKSSFDLSGDVEKEMLASMASPGNEDDGEEEVVASMPLLGDEDEANEEEMLRRAIAMSLEE